MSIVLFSMPTTLSEEYGEVELRDKGLTLGLMLILKEIDLHCLNPRNSSLSSEMKDHTSAGRLGLVKLIDSGWQAPLGRKAVGRVHITAEQALHTEVGEFHF